MGCFLVLLLVPVFLVHARLTADRPALATCTTLEFAFVDFRSVECIFFILQLLLAACAFVRLLLERFAVICFAFLAFVHLDG